MVREKTRKQYGIYFDESGKNGVYVFTAAVIELSKKKALEHQLLKIRREITTEVLSIDPNLTSHIKESQNGLFEIHAVDLYQSNGVYREIKRTDKKFWHRQHKWLQNTLAASDKYEVKYFYHESSDKDLGEVIAKIGHPADALGETKYKSVKEKFSAIFMNPYFVALLSVMHQIDNFLISENASGQIYCHTYDDANSYSTIESYSAVQKFGHFTRISQPVFKTCTEEQCIQCADTAGYVLLQEADSRRNEKPLKAEFRLWGKKYILRNIKDPGAIPTQDKVNSIGMLIFEMYVANPGGPPGFREALRDLWSKHLTTGVVTEGSNRSIIRAALRIAETKTNKPPSEDGDLYARSISRTDIEVKGNREDSETP